MVSGVKINVMLNDKFGSMHNGMTPFDWAQTHMQLEIAAEVKSTTGTTVANAMVANDGTKWDSQFANSLWVNPTKEMDMYNGAYRLDDLLNKDTIVSTGDTGRAYIASMSSDNLSVSDKAAVTQLIDESSTHVLTFADLGQYQNFPDRAAQIAYARGDTPKALQMVREAAVGGLIAGWASTSNNKSAQSLAMQASAVKEFGLTGTSKWNLASDTPLSLEGAVTDELAKNGEFYQAFLRAQYTETQSQLKSAGLSEVTLVRGQVAASPEENAFADAHPVESQGSNINAPKVGGDFTLSTRPISSWSTSIDSGRSFGIGFGGTNFPNATPAGLMYTAVVPADRILSVPTSGFGCYGEDEVVLLGGTDTVWGITVRNADTPVGISNHAMPDPGSKPAATGLTALGHEASGPVFKKPDPIMGVK
jgi:hypothetical protein